MVNFSARCNVRDLVRDLIKCGGMKGIISLFSHYVVHFQMCSNSCLGFHFHMFLFICLVLHMVEAPFDVIDENPSMRRSPAVTRVEDMSEQVKTKLPGALKFLLCVVAERKNSNIYGWLILLNHC